MIKWIYHVKKYANEFVLNFLNARYLGGKKSLPFTKYHPMLKLLKSRGVQGFPTKSYHDRSTCVEMIQCNVKYVKKTTMEHKKASLFWGFVEDESIDISMNTHMICLLVILGAWMTCIHIFYLWFQHQKSSK